MTVELTLRSSRVQATSDTAPYRAIPRRRPRRGARAPRRRRHWRYALPVGGLKTGSTDGHLINLLSRTHGPTANWIRDAEKDALIGPLRWPLFHPSACPDSRGLPLAG